MKDMTRGNHNNTLKDAADDDDYDRNKQTYTT